MTIQWLKNPADWVGFIVRLLLLAGMLLGMALQKRGIVEAAAALMVAFSAGLWIGSSSSERSRQNTAIWAGVLMVVFAVAEFLARS